MKGKYLITTDGWFYAPDGKTYRAVWGNVEIIEDVFLGVKTNKNSSNWFAKVGNKKNHVIIAGCQIHYAIKTNKKPDDGVVYDYNTSAEHGIKTFSRPTQIYIAQ